VPNFFAGPSSDVKEDVIVYAVTSDGKLSEFSIAAFC
jgi:hypothetical protein